MKPTALALTDSTHMSIFAEVHALRLQARVSELERQNEELCALVRWTNSKLVWCRRLMVACGYAEFAYVLDA